MDTEVVPKLLNSAAMNNLACASFMLHEYISVG